MSFLALLTFDGSDSLGQSGKISRCLSFVSILLIEHMIVRMCGTETSFERIDTYLSFSFRIGILLALYYILIWFTFRLDVSWLRSGRHGIVIVNIHGGSVAPR